MMRPQSQRAQGRMTNHIRDLQIFYDDEIGSLDEPGRFLMKPAIAGIGNLTVHSSATCAPHLYGGDDCSLAAGERALPAAQSFSTRRAMRGFREFPPCHCNRRIPLIPIHPPTIRAMARFSGVGTAICKQTNHPDPS